jgi:hypothetical protein
VSSFDNMKEQASKAVDEHGEQIGQGADKAGDMAKDRLGAEHADQVDQGVDRAKSGLDSLDNQDDDIS